MITRKYVLTTPNLRRFFVCNLYRQLLKSNAQFFDFVVRENMQIYIKNLFRDAQLSASYRDFSKTVRNAEDLLELYWEPSRSHRLLRYGYKIEGPLYKQEITADKFDVRVSHARDIYGKQQQSRKTKKLTPDLVAEIEVQLATQPADSPYLEFYQKAFGLPTPFIPKKFT